MYEKYAHGHAYFIRADLSFVSSLVGELFMHQSACRIHQCPIEMSLASFISFIESAKMIKRFGTNNQRIQLQTPHIIISPASEEVLVVNRSSGLNLFQHHQVECLPDSCVLICREMSTKPFLRTCLEQILS